MYLNEKINKIKATLLKPQSVATGTLSILVFTVVSKALGFVREMVIAANFGTSWRFDALIVAMESTSTLGGIFSAAIAAMMVPIYVGVLRKNDIEKTHAYVTQILFISSLLLLGFGVLFSVFPHFFIWIFAPKFSGEAFEYAVRKMRITGFIPFIQGFHSLSIALLNAEKKYMLASIIQLIFNVVLIPMILIFAPFFSEASYLLAFITGLLMMDIALLYIFRKKIEWKKSLQFYKNPAVKETITLSLPLIITGSLGIINPIVDKAFASSLKDGSISALRYAQTIMGMVVTLIIGSFLTTVFTELSEQIADNNKKALENRLKKTSNDLFNLLVPLTFWMVLMAEPIIKIVYERGEFTSDSTQMVVIAFIGYSATLILSPVSNLMSLLFKAYKKTNTLLLITIISILLNFVFNALLIKKLGILGLTLSTSFVTIVLLLVSGIIQRKIFKIKYFDKSKIIIITLFSAILFVILLFLKNQIHYKLWLIIANIVFLIFLVYFNKRNVLILYSKIKRHRL